MKNTAATLAFLSVFLALPCCTPSNITPPPDADASPPPPPSPSPGSDAAPPPPPSDPCAASCAAAKAAGCPEGQLADCAATCNKLSQDPGMVHPNTSCLASAKSQAAIRACGWTCKTN